ncbi:MAG: hypothetical protein AAF685_03715 [Cyanobacteria bacterium P01_C01_bin.89]
MPTFSIQWESLRGELYRNQRADYGKFEHGEGFPTDLALDVPTVGEFLAALDLGGESVAFSRPDRQSLAIASTKSQKPGRPSRKTNPRIPAPTP